MNWYRRWGKRILDIILAGSGLIILSPLIAFLALVIRITMGSPVIFRQKRPGLHGKPFTLYKFRTMTNARDEQGNLLPDEQRLTRLGRFLRKTSLDELPELWNVLKGDMSLVGPRPLLMKYLPFFTEKEKKRFEIRPGITGLAQIKGRNYLNWDKRLALDVYYVDNLSLFLDIKIILATLTQVIKREGVVDSPRNIMLDLDEERKSLKNKTQNSK